MARPRLLCLVHAALVLALVAALPAACPAGEAGVIKVSRGAVHVDRGRQKLPAAVGARLQEGDVVTTGPDGAVGIIFPDNSLLSAGPNSVLAIDRFAFDPTTHAGALETSLKKGTLAAISGKIARQTPDAMKVRTPAAVLGARGTEFAVRVGEPAP